MDNEKEISFGAFDSELMHQEIFIPKGFEATIDGDKIILKKIESEDEKVRKIILDQMKCWNKEATKENCEIDIEASSKCIAWLEKQGEQKPIDKIQLGKKYKCIASPRYSTFRRGNIYKPVDNFLCNLMNLCYECFEPIEDSEQKSVGEEIVEALRTEYEKGRADAFAQMQKHNDAIKPKFNVGDYIVSNSGLKYYITGIFKGYYMTESGCIITLDAQDNYKVYNNFWSKEEEELLNNICNLLQNPDSIKANQHVIGNIVDWLKSIKNRVQTKQEWSKEDDKIISEVIQNYESGFLPSVIERDGIVKALKSLKQKIGWKPSDEQINTLQDAIVYVEGCNSNFKGNGSVLENLYLQLKKLK